MSSALAHPDALFTLPLRSARAPGCRPAGGTGYDRSMVAAVLVATGKVWHYWIGLVLVIAAILAVLATVVGYLVRVQAPQYPRKRKS